MIFPKWIRVPSIQLVFEELEMREPVSGPFAPSPSSIARRLESKEGFASVKPAGEGKITALLI